MEWTLLHVDNGYYMEFFHVYVPHLAAIYIQFPQKYIPSFSLFLCPARQICRKSFQIKNKMFIYNLILITVIYFYVRSFCAEISEFKN